MVDPDDVNIIVDGDQEEFEEEGSDGEERNLNRKTDNMADYNREMQNKLKNLQIIDDQNLDMMDDNQDEDQHYPDEEDE
jgi:hypothetical protein